MPDNQYERGQRNGRTQATFEGIADSLDDIRERFDRLACRQHAADIASVKTWIKLVGGFGGAVFLLMLGILLKMVLL